MVQILRNSTACLRLGSGVNAQTRGFLRHSRRPRQQLLMLSWKRGLLMLSTASLRCRVWHDCTLTQISHKLYLLVVGTVTSWPPQRVVYILQNLSHRLSGIKIRMRDQKAGLDIFLCVVAHTWELENVRANITKKPAPGCPIVVTAPGAVRRAVDCRGVAAGAGPVRCASVGPQHRRAPPGHTLLRAPACISAALDRRLGCVSGLGMSPARPILPCRCALPR